VRIPSIARRAFALATRIRHTRVILDTEKRLGNFGAPIDDLPVLTTSKEELSRNYVFGEPGAELTFLDVGAHDGALSYMLGISGNLEFSDERYRANLERFRAKYRYYGMDLQPSTDPNVLVGDICSPRYVDEHARFRGFFDVIYSNNVFEHLRRPWDAARNVCELLKPGGLAIVIAPFSQRYHRAPEDHFRYTHVGLRSLFEDVSPINVLECGYDLAGRRNNWQGSGEVSDLVPEDRFGAWRETWFTVLVFRKKAVSSST
jgi:SAM-dependent methyltransferase